MHRVALFWLALVVAGFASPLAAHAADPPPTAAPSAEFDAFVKKGDQARIAGKWSDALKAYAKALEMRDDPLVAGRLGLVFVEFRAYDAAAGKLFQAVEQAAGANDAERIRFFQAFLVAKGQTCRLDVVVVQNGVNLEIDGEPRFAGRREGWTFVTAGKHKIKATLEGFEDQTMEIDAPKGGQLSIKVELHPVKPAEEPTKEPDTEPLPSNSDWNVPEDKPISELIADKPMMPTNSTQKNGSFVVGFGGALVIGATPAPAVGLNLFGAWRSRTWWEVGVDARVAWTVFTDERFPETQFVTWSASVTPCGRLRDRWFGCLQIGVDGMASGEKPKIALLPLLGVRGGYEFVLGQRLRLQLFGDATGHPFAFEFRRKSAVWQGFFLTGGLGGRLVYIF